MSLFGFVQEYGGEGAEAGHASGAMPFEELPGFTQDHIADGRYIEVFGAKLDMSGVHFPSFEVFGLTVDFSPTRHLVFMLIAALLCIMIFVPLARSLVRKDPSKAPSGFANAMESLILYFRDEVVRPNIGHGADGYTPFILTVFFFIWFMNLLGLTPFGITATANLSVTAALAIIAFIATEVSGMRALGPAGYARTIFFVPAGVPALLKPVMLLIMTPVEFMGKLTKPFALAVRLFANMVAGHSLVLALLGLIFVYQGWGIATGSVLVVSAIMILELFVATLQAYIFAMLTSVFIGLIRHAH
ncbi:F0F1 ATP synthase subunit A [Gaopeijia maritima]|uniref:ATP synthase subunit a n=1 Tax=Gaopeijia maritima TaxID=3119007 RepID=A0ABU9EDL9_9BACT